MAKPLVKMGKGGKKLRRAAKNRRTNKYDRQFLRTEANLKRKGKTNKKIKG